MSYIVVIERVRGGFSAYVPDLPGCIATGRTMASVEKRIREAIAFHLDGLREDGLKAPRPTTRTLRVHGGIAPTTRVAGRRSA